MHGGIEMIKKILTAFFCLCSVPAIADNYIKFKATAIEETINTMVPESHRQSAADEYQKQMDSTTGKISVMGIYKVCAAAGFNINNTNGYNGCRLFINTIAEKSGFGFGVATQQNCANKFNGIWTLSPDGKQYQCVGKDGHKLVYSESCRSGAGECVKIFSNLQTQVPIAKEFINAYGNTKGVLFTCSNEPVDIKKIGDDYIKCSAGGVAYEFKFDDLNQGPGKTAVESENTALCEMFGGKIVKRPDGGIEKEWQSCDISRDVCDGPLHNLAIKIGHNVMYQGYCRLSRTVKETSIVGLKTLPGVDSRVFYNTGAQMRADMAKPQAEEYLRTKFPNETYINCDPSVKALNDPTKINPEYVMTCTVGAKQVDFIFHDLTEGADYSAESGAAKMACAIVAERVDGKNCRGLDQNACTDLDNKLKQMGRRGTEYKPEKGGCILLDTQTEELVNLGLEIAGGVALTVVTGGYGALVVAASVATDIGFDALNRWLRKIPYNDYQEFMKHANECSDTDTSIENQYCVADVLNTYYALIMGNMSDLAPEIQSAASEKLQSMLNILSDEDVLSIVSGDKIPTLKQGRNYISFAAMGLIFIVNPDKMASKGDDLIRQATKMGKTISRAGNKIDDMIDAARMFGRTNVDDIGIYSKGWKQHTIGGDNRFKIKKISYPGEADDVRRALESGVDGAPNQAFLGVKDDYIYITYKSDIKTTGPIFDDFMTGAARMFGRTNVDDIGMVDKGWNRLTLENNSIFRQKKISYPGEADDVRRALESSNGHNLAFLGVKDDYIVITYKSDLNRAQPMFNRYMSGANVDAPIQIPAARFGAADMWRHPSDPTRIYTTEEMSEIIHRTGQYGGDTSGLTGWEPVETVSGVTRTPVAEAKHTPPVQPTTGNQNNRTLADDLVEERQVSSSSQSTTPTQQKPPLDISRNADDIASVIQALPSRVPQTLDEERDVLNKLEDFFSANPNNKPSSAWTARSAAEDAYIKRYGAQLDEIGEQRLRSVLDDGYGLGNINWEDLDYLKRERLGISDVEQNFLKTVEEWLNL